MHFKYIQHNLTATMHILTTVVVCCDNIGIMCTGLGVKYL